MKCEKSGNHTISYQSLLLSTTVLNDIYVYIYISPPSMLHVFTQVYNCSWVDVHTCTNETHSLALLQYLIPTLAA